jgi:hypothetical protein
VESADSKLGYLPGEIDAKMSVYATPLYDKLEELLNKNDIQNLTKESRLTMLVPNYIRGMNWTAKLAIIDECIAGHHFIVTDTGKVSLRSLEENFRLGKPLPQIKTFNEKLKIFEYKPIKKVWSKGVKKIITVKTGNRKIDCTPNHLFLTSHGWKRADSLLAGDILIANDENAHQTLNSMNEDQKQIFLGSFLGDGSISNHGINRNRLRVIHGMQQNEYCEWKAEMMNSPTIGIEKNGYSQKPAIKFSTKCFALDDFVFSDRKKSCPDWVIDNLDLRGIAIWYMDDGSTGKGKNAAHIFTCSFDERSQKKFVNKFKSFGIDCRYERHKEKYFMLTFNAENTRKLLDNIYPYFHRQMSYKSNKMMIKGYDWNNNFLKYNQIVCDGFVDENKSLEVFDMEVEDNHNFIIACSTRGEHGNNSGMVVHNCQNITQKEIITIITRIGKFSKCILLADPEQSDLFNGKAGGFVKIRDAFNDEEAKKQGIYTFEFTADDIMRSELVKFIVKRLEQPKPS